MPFVSTNNTASQFKVKREEVEEGSKTWNLVSNMFFESMANDKSSTENKQIASK